MIKGGCWWNVCQPSNLWEFLRKRGETYEYRKKETGREDEAQGLILSERRRKENGDTVGYCFANKWGSKADFQVWIKAAHGEYILFAEDGANDLNNYPILYVNGKIWVNNHAHTIQGKASKAKTEYLSYALKTVDFVQVLVGGTRAKLNGKVAKV